MIAEAPAKDVVVKSEGGTLTGEVLPPAPQPVAFERLHALVRKGYVANIGAETGTEVIVLRHLGKAPDLILHGNGVVEGFDGRRPWHKRSIDAPPAIAADRDAEHLRFMKFLDTVPKASLRDRTRPWRHKYVYFPAALIVLWAVCIGITAAIMGG